MTRRFTEWLTRRWSPQPLDELCVAYQITFSTPHGQLVLQHLLDEVYCQTCPSLDPIALATHNGCRSVVQDILEKIEIAESRTKRVHTEAEEMTYATNR